MLKLILIALSFAFGILTVRYLRKFDAVLEGMSRNVTAKAEHRWWCPGRSE